MKSHAIQLCRRLDCCRIGHWHPRLVFAEDNAQEQAEATQFEFFEEKIRPVLVQNCYECHSADAKNIKGGLLLDTRAATLKGGDTGPAVVPKNVNDSFADQCAAA